ncbi:hypothetical protein AB0J83_39995 [Actinoplanes sp. NPDC049596]|uniref:hypothetical protein n=1 Tax=unclassified Actinoplanes TaxID=2626549 RepID=UPI003445DF73
MSDLSADLFQRWYHSFEEDTDDEAVYRPADFDFPPRRAPRDSLEFRPGGGYIEYGPGPADRSTPTWGSWEAEQPDAVRVHAGAATRLLHITAHDGQVLKIRK